MIVGNFHIRFANFSKLKAILKILLLIILTLINQKLIPTNETLNLSTL